MSYFAKGIVYPSVASRGRAGKQAVIPPNETALLPDVNCD
jgi:hypothetical protein